MGQHRRPYHPSGLYAAQPPELPNPSTPLGAILAGRRDALIGDLGGPESCSTAQLALVDLAIRAWALLDSVDSYLLSLPSPVDKRHRRVWRVVEDRGRLAAQLEGTLMRLGLERRPRAVESFDTYKAARSSDGQP